MIGINADPVNSQGRTVVWNNVLLRYFMLHVHYKLNIQPKKKMADNRVSWSRYASADLAEVRFGSQE